LTVDRDDDVRGALEQLLEVDRREPGDGSHARPRRGIVGAEGSRVKAALVLALVAGCFWRSYGRIAATHVDLLTAMAHKGADLVASGRLTAESMPELTYPLERAQAFVQKARARAGDDPPPSIAALGTLVARYREF